MNKTADRGSIDWSPRDQIMQPTIPKQSGAPAPMMTARTAQLLGMAVMLALLVIVAHGAVVASRWGLVVLFILLWLPMSGVMYWYARQRRRLFLVHLRDQSYWKRWLQGGPIMLGLRMVVAVPLSAGLLVALSQNLDGYIRLGLVLAMGLWVLSEPAIKGFLARHYRPIALAYSSQWLTLALVGALLWLGLLVVSFWQHEVADVADLTGTQAFKTGQKDALGHDDWLKQLAGYWVGLEYVLFWLAERFSSTDLPLATRLGVWLLVLGQRLLFVLSLLLLLQGGALAGQALLTRSAVRGRIKPTRPVGISLGVAAALICAIVLWAQIAYSPWTWLTGRKLLVSVAGQDYRLSPAELDQKVGKALLGWHKKAQGTIDAAEQPLYDRIDQTFAAAKKRTPEYADWRYSLRGELQSAGAYMLSKQQEQLQKFLFPENGLKRLSNNLAQSFDQQSQKLHAKLGNELGAQVEKALGPFKAHPHDAKARWAQPLSLKAAYDGHLAAQLLDKANMQKRAAWALGAGSLTGVGVGGTAMLARYGRAKAVQAGGRRLSWQGAKKGIQMLGSRLAARTIPFLTSSVAGVGCSAGGPIAAACAAGTFAATAMATEKLAIKYDEYNDRDELEEGLADRLDKMRQQIKGQVQKRFVAFRDIDKSELKERIEKPVTNTSSHYL